MQFIYRGEARFFEERMSEFLLVSKNLEIQDLVTCIEMNDYDQSTSNDQGIEHDDDNEEYLLVNKDAKFPNYEDIAKVEPQAYACNQCDQQFTVQSNFTQHIQSKHEGFKYACNQCDQQFTLQSHLSKHIQFKHEGVKYACNQCEQQFTLQSNLIHHIKRKHL